MKTVFKTQIIIYLFALVACNKNKSTLKSNEWVAVSITHENGNYTTPESEYKFILENNNKFSLKLDVNQCWGKVYFGKKSVEFKNHNASSTLVCCDSEFAETLAIDLYKTTKWDIVGNQLILKNDKGLKIVFNQK